MSTGTTTSGRPTWDDPGRQAATSEALRRIRAALAEHVWNGTPDGGVRGYTDTIDAAAFLDVLARHDLTIVHTRAGQRPTTRADEGET